MFYRTNICRNNCINKKEYLNFESLSKHGFLNIDLNNLIFENFASVNLVEAVIAATKESIDKYCQKFAIV